MVGLIVWTQVVFAGTTRVCAASETAAQVHGSWSLLDEGDVFGEEALDATDGNARSSLMVAVEEELAVDLCPKYDPYGGLQEVARAGFEMVSVDMDPSALGGSCPVMTRASASGQVGGEVRFGMGAIDVEARGGVQVDMSGENTGSIDADAGSGGSFEALWRYSVPTTSARVQGNIVIDLEDAYAGVNLNMPGVARIHAWDGYVDAWIRRGDRFMHIEGQAPMILEVDYIAPRAGELCAAGNASVGSFGDERTGLLYRQSSLKMHLEVVQSEESVDRLVGDVPRFERCGCQ